MHISTKYSFKYKQETLKRSLNYKMKNGYDPEYKLNTTIISFHLNNFAMQSVADLSL